MRYSLVSEDTAVSSFRPSDKGIFKSKNISVKVLRLLLVTVKYYKPFTERDPHPHSPERLNKTKDKKSWRVNQSLLLFPTQELTSRYVSLNSSSHLIY